MIFYHGGCEPDFTVEKIDILRIAEKQQKRNRNYAGFYMYGKNNRDSAFHYCQQENIRKNTTTKGVVEIELDELLNIYEMESGTITRIRQEQLIELQNKGYDLVCGKMLGKMEYVLLNKSKIKTMKFLPYDTRYSSDEEKQQIENGHFNDFIEAKEKDMKKIAILREQQVQNNMQMNQNASINISR